MMIWNQLYGILGMVVCVLLLSSCGNVQPAVTTPASTITEDVGSTEPISDTYTFDDLGGNLNNLTSYRMDLHLVFAGRDAQNAQQQSRLHFQQIVNVSSGNRMLALQTSQEVARSRTRHEQDMRLFEIGEHIYLVQHSTGDTQGPQCLPLEHGETAENQTDDLADRVFPVTPADVIGGIQQATLAEQTITVNGIVTDQYTFTQVNFGAFETVEGSVWIAQQGGFVVRYIGQATGTNPLSSEAQGTGTFEWEYTIQDINQVAAIAVPDSCHEAELPQ